MTSTSTKTDSIWPFERSRTERMITGVAGGLASALGISPVYVRAAFVAASLAGGFGLIVYVLLGVFASEEEWTDTAPLVEQRQATRRQTIGLATMFFAGMVALQSIGMWFGPIVWPLSLVIFGLAIAIETSGVNYERSLQGVTTGRRSWWLVVAGLVMMVAGQFVVLRSTEALQSAAVVLIAVIVALAGFTIVAGPWLWSLIEDLRTERRARIRSEERAEMAAHLHDSVLQTLALIQRTDDPKKMVTLARSQERELRSWLFDERGSDPQTLQGALADAATKVEQAHDVPVTVVVAGESPLARDRLNAIVGAATEAMMNAAKHSGAEKVSVYAEADDEKLDVWVTDQGKGFDREGVDGDRRGISESIEARMRRHGGTVTIDSVTGEGTEVHLTMTGGTP